jgi:hypothetical protein
MNCPGCASAMTSLTVDGHLGTHVDLDMCPTCQVIWFDRLESLRLAPAAVLRLFRVIGERSQLAPAPITRTVRCPRCDLRLVLTHDRQRNTPFRYWRCGKEHGRLITFFEFLREKDFIRPLSPRQLEELRKNIQMIHCSNCGAPIDLASASDCTHCGAPISMLDVGQVKETAAALEQASAPKSIDPLLPARLVHEKFEIEHLFASLRADSAWSTSPRVGLVESGLFMLAKWLT